MRVKNNFNFNNGHNNAIGKQSRNTNMHNVSSGIKNFNKNITPTTSKVVGNQFEFRNENDQMSFNDSYTKNSRGNTK